jgi:hypothetical protein
MNLAACVPTGVVTCSPVGGNVASGQECTAPGNTRLVCQHDGSGGAYCALAEEGNQYLTSCTRASAGSPPVGGQTTCNLEEIRTGFSTSGALAFGDVTVGMTSAAQSITFTNSGNVAVRVDAVVPGDEFVMATDSCSSVTIPVNGICSVGVSFRPSGRGAVTGNLTLSYVYSDSVYQVTEALAGTGVGGPAPALTMSPSSLVFPSTMVAATSAPLRFTITNSGATRVEVESLVVASPFFLRTNTCVRAYAIGETCDADVEFIPSLNGPVNDTVQVVWTPNIFSSLRETAVVALSGSGFGGIGASALLRATPTTADFGVLLAGQSAVREIRIENIGAAAAQLTARTISPPFTVERDDCPAMLAVGQHCTIQVSLSIVVAGETNFTGTLTLPYVGATAPLQITLTGGTRFGLGRVSLSPNPAVIAGGGSRKIILTNVDATPFVLNNVGATSGFTVRSTDCFGKLLARNASCELEVAHSSGGLGTTFGEITVASLSGTRATARLTGISYQTREEMCE